VTTPVRRLTLSLTALLTAAGVAACGQKSNTITPVHAQLQPLTLMLDYFPNADHVGIYAAQAEHFFRQAGLDVRIEVPSDPSTPLKLVADGKVDLAVSYEPEVMLARNAGEPVASIAAIVQVPLTSIVSLGSAHITSVNDLRGKTVGDAGIPYQHAYLQTILQHAGIPAASVREVNVGFNLVPAMLSKQVAATIGAFWNYEAIQLRQMGKKPDVLRMPQLGVPTYNELVLVAREGTISGKETRLRRFVQALGRGYEFARQHPAAAVDDLLAASPGLDRKLQLASVRATLPYFFPAKAKLPWGYQNQSQWNAYGAWMLSHGLISNPNAVVDASTNELLAGVGI
jgi:putative hydroxymethylpyrimidine transport system substrate-binding protein